MTKMKSMLFLIIFHFPIIIFGQETIQDSLRIEKITNKIKNEMFEIGFKKKNIPGIIRHKLKVVDREKFKIADKGGSWGPGDAGLDGSLPNKRIVYVAYNKDMYIITYEQGGFGRTYYSRVIEYEKRDVKCITTLKMPPHDNVDDFKRIMEKKELIKYVAEKSLCSV